MLVIVSDLHLTDGTTGLGMPVGAFRTLRQRLEDMAYDASWRDDNTYRPIEEFDLLLLGDIFDMLRTTKWNDELIGEPGFARPWSDPKDPAFVKKVEQIVDGILQQNSESLQILHRMAEGTAISLSPARKSGLVDLRVSRDPRSKKRLPVKVNIHYMNGNHDWFFHLPGAEFDRIRQKIIDRMGLQNPSTRFPYEPKESPVIQSLLSKHNVFARHGDKYDPFNFIEKRGRDYSSLGDALVVDLFNPFPKAVYERFYDKLPKEFFDDLNDMGSIRPSTLTPVWIASLLERYQVISEQRAEIFEIWRNLLDEFLALEFLDELNQPLLIDLVDTVKAILGILRHLSFERLDEIAPYATRLIELHSTLWGGGELGFDKNALKEDAYLKEEAQFIVFGHTHGFKVLPMRSISKNGKPFDQIYINSGTWHPLHELGHANPKERSFIMHKTMSYLGFYLDNERKGRLFETWTGTLDI